MSRHKNACISIDFLIIMLSNVSKYGIMFSLISDTQNFTESS